MLRAPWDDTVLNVHAQGRDNTDDSEGQFLWEIRADIQSVP